MTATTSGKGALFCNLHHGEGTFIMPNPYDVGSALARAALGAFLRAGAEMAEKGTFTFAENAAGFDELQTIFSDFTQRR